MGKVSVMFKLDQVVLNALESEARADHITIADLIRDAIQHDLCSRGKAPKTQNYDPNVVAVMQRLLSRDFAVASGWEDLQQRLHKKGYALRSSGGGLAVFDSATKKRMAQASHFGTSAQILKRRFGAALPETTFPG